MTIDDLGREFGDDWFLDHQSRSGLWVATLKADNTVRVSAMSGEELAIDLRKRMTAWSDLSS